MEDEDLNINIFYEEEYIRIPKNSTFSGLKRRILQQYKKFAKFFLYQNEKINENLLCRDFPSFRTILDNNEFTEYRHGQFRCKKCRRYLNLTTWNCKHSNSCRAFHLLFKKDKTTIELLSGYEEISEEEESQKKSDTNIDEEIKKLIDDKFEKERMRKLNKINSLLFKNSF